MQFLLLALFYLEYMVSSSHIQHRTAKAINEEQTNQKLNLLSEYVSLEWGYNSGRQKIVSADTFLKNISLNVLKQFDDPLGKKINSLKVHHVMKVFDRIVSNDEYVRDIYNLETRHYGYGLKTNWEKERNRLANMLDSMVLQQNEIAVDLLIQAFAPDNVSVFRHVYGKFYFKDLVEIVAVTRRRKVGVCVLLNYLLDHPFRLNTSINTIVKVSLRDLQKNLVAQARDNFGALIDEHDSFKSSMTTHSVPFSTTTFTLATTTSNQQLTTMANEVYD